MLGEWRTMCEQLEAENRREEAANLLQGVIRALPIESEPVIRLIYLLFNMLLEVRDLPSDQRSWASRLLLEVYRTSRERFAEDPTYLFFTSILMSVAGWHFGERDPDLPKAMRDRACALKPGHPLYTWGVAMNGRAQDPHDVAIISRAADNIVYKHPEIVRWLHAWGAPGIYVLSSIESASKRKGDA